MAKKDTAATVLGMLSTTGASTRPSGLPSPDRPRDEFEPPAVPEAATVPAPVATAAPEPREEAPPPPGSASHRRVPEPEAPAREVPRTLRLRASTAAALRDAWLEAKRHDVLLSHQDFASDLLDVALGQRQRSARR